MLNDHWLKERFKHTGTTSLSSKVFEYEMFGGTEQEGAECGLMKAELKRREQENENTHLSKNE